MIDWGKQGFFLLFGLVFAGSLWAEDDKHGVVLQYHHIDSKTPVVTSTSPKDFSKHLEYIANNGFAVWPLDRLVEHFKTGQSIPDQVVSISFDDAYLSIYQNAFPLLQEKNWPFTLFVSTDFVDSNAPSSLNWQQLAEMVEAGATVANHSRTHLHIPRLLDEESDEQRLLRIRDEILWAQQRIDSELGVQPKLFAYPYGEVDPAAQQLITELGYVAFGQQSGAIGVHSDFGFLPRFAASGAYAKIDDLAVKLWSLPLPVVTESPSSMVLPEGEVRPQLQLEILKGSFRDHQLSCYASGQGRIPAEVVMIVIDGEKRIQLTTQAQEDLQPGRTRYNCTAPDQRGRRYYWYSKPWLRAGYWD